MSLFNDTKTGLNEAIDYEINNNIFTDKLNSNFIDRFDVQLKLMQCFPDSFINGLGEFIAHKYSNAYFTLRDCKSEEDVISKVLEWLSRYAYKAQPYEQNWRNKKLHLFMLNGINKFLGTHFDEKDIELIYIKLGNSCNHELTIKFIKSGYDLNLLKE